MARKGNQAVRTVSFMMLITLLGKLLGMVREQFLAAKYATGVEGAAFMAASQVPRLFFDAIFASLNELHRRFPPALSPFLWNIWKNGGGKRRSRWQTVLSR